MTALVRAGFGILLGVCWSGLGTEVIHAENVKAQTVGASALFRTTNLLTVHFTFTAQQWEALEPKGGPGPFGGPGGPGTHEIGPSMFLAPAFLKDGDLNQDGKLSRDEFLKLSEKWHGKWNTQGSVNDDQLRDGLNGLITFPGFGPPGANQDQGHGPDHPMAMNLQGAEGKRNGLSSMMGIEFEYAHAEMDLDGQLYKDVGVRYKGNGTFMESRGSLKRSFKVELNKYVKGQKLGEITTLNLHNNVTDPSWMNEVLSHRLFRDAGVPAPRTAYAKVFVTVPGKYHRKYFGLYSVVQNIDKSFTEDNFHSRKGAILKPVTPNLFADLGEDWSKYQQTYDPKTDLSKEQIGRIIEFCRLVSKANDADFAAQFERYLDVEEFARFMAATVWLSTLDSILIQGQNYYIYLNPKTQKMQFLPWDLDHSFGQFPMIGSQEERENLSILHPWRGENRFLERVFGSAAFQKIYLAKMKEFSGSIFKPERICAQVDEIAPLVRPAVAAESKELLASFDQVVAGEAATPRDGGGPGHFMPPSKPIKPFVKARTLSVQDQLAGKTKGSVLSDFGFFGGPGPGDNVRKAEGPGRQGGPGGPGGPGGFGPGMFLGPVFMAALDANKDGKLSKDEMHQGFVKWFEAWNTDKSGIVTEEQLRKGIDHDLGPSEGMFPGGPRMDRKESPSKP